MSRPSLAFKISIALNVIFLATCVTLEQVPFDIEGGSIECFLDSETPNDRSDDMSVGGGSFDIHGSFVERFDINGFYRFCRTDDELEKQVYCEIDTSVTATTTE